MKVKHNDRFFIINNEGFFYQHSDVIQTETGEKQKYLQYQWVIPMFVHSINQIWNGTENFDLCPVDCETLAKTNNNWKWKRSFEYDEIGKTIFLTEEEAWKVYNEKYSEENRKVFQEIRKTRFLQERKAELI